jgi:hypothetical protein
MKLDPLEQEYKKLNKTKKSKTMTSSKVVCPNCHHPAQANDINIQDKLAKCSSCHEVFSFQHTLQSLLNQTQQIEKKKLGRQKDIDIFEFKGELSISIINFTDSLALITLILSVITGFGIIVSATDHGMSAAMPFIISTILLVIFTVYRFIGYKNNKTYIDIDDQYLYIRNRPKNFQKDKIYNRSNIQQIYQKVYGGHPDSSPYYHVWMIYDGTEGEEHIKITPYLRSRSRALYLEQELENYLGITDESVPEETRLEKG